MELPDKAAGALAVLRRDGRAVRFAVEEVCHTGRYRLSARYRSAEGDEVRLGLVYAEDQEALEGLCARLAAVAETGLPGKPDKKLGREA
jgi:hypothetical protein